MRAFEHELDELEEWIVYPSLVFLGSTILLLFGQFLGFFLVVVALTRSLSFLAATIAVVLWLIRRFASPLYDRFRMPDKNRIQSLMSEKAPPY